MELGPVRALHGVHPVLAEVDVAARRGHLLHLGRHLLDDPRHVFRYAPAAAVVCAAAVAERRRLALWDDVFRDGDRSHERAECEAAEVEVILLLHEALRDELVGDGLFGAVEGHHRLEVPVVGLKGGAK